MRGVRPRLRDGRARQDLPHCGSGETYLLQGREVMIKQIETPDEDPADAAPDGLSDAPDAVDAANPLHIA